MRVAGRYRYFVIGVEAFQQHLDVPLEDFEMQDFHLGMHCVTEFVNKCIPKKNKNAYHIIKFSSGTSSIFLLGFPPKHQCVNEWFRLLFCNVT